MKPPLPFLLAAAAVFAGAAFFHKNRAAENEAENETQSHPGGLTINAFSVPLPVTISPVTPSPANISPPPPRPAPAAGTLIQRVERKLQATAKPEVLSGLSAWTDDLVLATVKRVAGLSDEEAAKVKAHLAVTRLGRQRNSLRMDLTPAERIAAQTELNLSSDAWLEEFLGEERFGKYDASRKARQRADAEIAASQGLSRISRAVPLRPEQKDALYAGFVSAAMDPAAQAIDPITQFRITSSLNEEPGRPDILDEAKATLSAEQWAQYQEQGKLWSEGMNKAQQHLMGMMPVLLASLQELMAESPKAEKKP